MLLVVASCTTDDGEGSASTEPGWAMVDSLDDGAFRAGWRDVDSLDLDRYVRLEQFDETDRRTAIREFVDRPGHTAALVDSSGAFAYGFFDPFVSGGPADPRSPDFAPYVLPDEAPYLSPRNRERYAITVLADSVRGGRAVRRVEIRARPGAGDDESIRRVRFTLDAGSGRLVAVLMERVDPSLLFTEQSRIFVEMRSAEGDALRPFLVRYETWLRARIGSDRRFRMVSAWYGGGQRSM